MSNAVGTRPMGAMPRTQWTQVRIAGEAGSAQGRKALEELLHKYLPPLRAHLVLKRGIEAEKAEDLLQAFIVNRVLEQELIARADQKRGRFRTFLLTALDRFVISQYRAEAALKRSPPPTMHKDVPESMPPHHREKTPSAAFEIQWARDILQEAIQRMQEHCEASGRMDLWGVFDARLLGPLLDGTPRVPYGALVERFGFDSPAQASNALVTAKRMFARFLRRVVADYLPNPEDIEQELRDLQKILSGLDA